MFQRWKISELTVDGLQFAIYTSIQSMHNNKFSQQTRDIETVLA